MKLPRDLRRIRDAAHPAEISAMSRGALAAVLAVGFVLAFRAAGFWLVWASAQVDALRSILGL
jgi:hypothetical protein